MNNHPMTTPETLLRKWLQTHSRTDFNRELIEETEKWLGDRSEQHETNPFEQLRAWCNTKSRELPIEQICRELEESISMIRKICASSKHKNPIADIVRECDRVDEGDSSSSDVCLESFQSGIEKQIEFWRTNQNDPHGIGNAVLASLYCIRDALTTQKD